LPSRRHESRPVRMRFARRSPRSSCTPSSGSASVPSFWIAGATMTVIAVLAWRPLKDR
jgi:hypothetical protein